MRKAIRAPSTPYLMRSGMELETETTAAESKPRLSPLKVVAVSVKSYTWLFAS